MKNLFLILMLLFSPTIKPSENKASPFFSYDKNIDFKIAITTEQNELLAKIYLAPMWSSPHDEDSIKNVLEFVPTRDKDTVGLLLYAIPKERYEFFKQFDGIINRKIRVYFASKLFFESQLVEVHIDTHGKYRSASSDCIFILYKNTNFYANTGLNPIPPLKIRDTNFFSLFNTSKNFTISIIDDSDNIPFFEYILPLGNYTEENHEPSSLYFIPPYNNPNLIGILAQRLLATWGNYQNPFKRTKPIDDGHNFRNELAQYIKNIENAGKKAWLTIYLGEGNTLFTGEFVGVKIDKSHGYGAQLGATTHDVLFILDLKTVQSFFM